MASSCHAWVDSAAGLGIPNRIIRPEAMEINSGMGLAPGSSHFRTRFTNRVGPGGVFGWELASGSEPGGGFGLMLSSGSC